MMRKFKSRRSFASRFREIVFTEAARDEYRLECFAANFPELRSRLDRALARNGLEPTVGEMAHRHPLCAEALACILEEAAGSRKRISLDQENLACAYATRVGVMLREFLDQPAQELACRFKGFARVNVKLVALACERGLLHWDNATAALEDRNEYHLLLRNLQQAGWLPGSPEFLK